MSHAAIYVRISSDREGRELGVERQEQDCRTLAQRLNITSMQVYSDNDISASRRSKKPRPGYNQMLTDVRAGTIDVVLSYSTSRLTRRPREFEDWIDLAEHGEVRISTIAAGDVDLTTAAGRFMARMLAARDSAEAEEMSERAKREREQRREQGRWHGGNRPFGFEPDGTTPRPLEQELIRRACRDVLTGRSLASIAREWSKATSGTPQGRISWLHTSARDVLKNPRIAGMLPDGRKAVWAPIVPEEEWRGVIAVLADPQRRRERGDSRLLTSIATCGICGATVHGGVDRNGKPTYRCSRVKHLDRRAEAVDEFVTEVVIQWIIRAGITPRDPLDDTAGIAHEVAGYRARLTEAADMFADGRITPVQLDRITSSLKGKIEQHETRMLDTNRHNTLAGLPLNETALAELWTGYDIDRRRALIRATGIRVTLNSPGRGAQKFDPATVVIGWS